MDSSFMAIIVFVFFKCLLLFCFVSFKNTSPNPFLFPGPNMPGGVKWFVGYGKSVYERASDIADYLVLGYSRTFTNQKTEGIVLWKG